MIMQMLETAGLPLLIDGVRPPDSDNPRGYYEFEPVKAMKTDASFLEVAVGRVVKVVAPLLPSLPPRYDYRIVFVERALCEVLASQRAMLAQRGQVAGIAEGGALAKAFESSLRTTKDWMERAKGVRVCFVSHADTVESPERTARRLLQFFASIWAGSGGSAGVGAIESERDRIVMRMTSVFEDSLYRRRGSGAG